MAETNTWIGKVINISKWKTEFRNNFFVICALLYFGYRDYSSRLESVRVNNAYIELANRDRNDKIAVQLKYDKLLDKTIFRQERQNDLNDSLENYVKRLEAKNTTNDK